MHLWVNHSHLHSVISFIWDTPISMKMTAVPRDPIRKRSNAIIMTKPSNKPPPGSLIESPLTVHLATGLGPLVYEERMPSSRSHSSLVKHPTHGDIQERRGKVLFLCIHLYSTLPHSTSVVQATTLAKRGLEAENSRNPHSMLSRVL